MPEKVKRRPRKGSPEWEERDLLNLRVPLQEAQEFRVEAVQRRITQIDLFMEMWKLYKGTQHGAA